MLAAPTASDVGFRAAMAGVAAAVAVVTVIDRGRPRGCTISSLTSLSLDPPLLLFCLAQDSGTHAAFDAAARFSVSVLGAEQADVANRFAGPLTGRDVDWCWLDGLPVVSGSLVRIACSVYDRFVGGDHTILLGRVCRAQARDGAPLVHPQRRSHTPHTT